MSEHNTELTIKEVYSDKQTGRIKAIHIQDNENQLYIVYNDVKTKSVITIDSGKIDHKDVLKFVRDFIKETEKVEETTTEPKTDV